MAFNSEAYVRGDAAAELAELRALRRERIVTVAGTTLAVMVVAAIAVLMGMA